MSQDDDPWLTIAEIAEELRVNPATVRLWVSKGILPARRAGRRKLLVRRSDLDVMLTSAADDRPTGAEHATAAGPTEPGRPPESVRQLTPGEQLGPLPSREQVHDAVQSLQLADAAWSDAQAASENAPPDPDFPDRLHALAVAAHAESRALAQAASVPRMIWTPLPGGRDFTISHELRPGANRPGSAAMWREFDHRVQRLGLAMEGHDTLAIAARWRDLADILHSITDSLPDATPDAHQEQR